MSICIELRVTWPASCNLIHSRAARRVGSVDSHTRSHLSRDAGVLPNQEPDGQYGPAAQVLLPVYLRVLLQPLRVGDLSRHHAFQAAVSGLARLSDLLIRVGLGLQLLHQHLQPPAPEHQARAHLDQQDAARG